MDKKTIFLELPADVVDKIDQKNTTGDRSAFITDLLSNKLKDNVSTMNQMDPLTEFTTRMTKVPEGLKTSGELKVINKHGQQLGIFDVNTVEGFEQLAEKISNISDDPIVRMKARKWR